MMGCTRRSFLGVLLAASWGGVSLASCARRSGGQSTFAAWSDWLLGDGGNRDAVVRVGRLYLASRPGEVHLGTLLEKVDHAIAGRLHNTDPATVTVQEAGAALDGVVRGEYAGGQVVEVDGWVLSASEVRVYAAIALLAGIGGELGPPFAGDSSQS